MLGAGSWGTTVASLLARRNRNTVIWSRDEKLSIAINDTHVNDRYLSGFTLPRRLRATSDLEEAVADADVLVVGVPTHGFRDILNQVKPFVRPWIPIVSLSKGLEQGSLLRMTEVIRDVLPGHPAAAMTGPNLAREIMEGCAAASVIATEDLDVATALQGMMSTDFFRIYTNHDVVGCELGGALKNVVAIATGIAQGLSVGDNTRAAVITRGLGELTRLAVALGGEPATLSGLAGMGDLIATCMSPHSRNRWVGEQLGAGRPLEEILSGMPMVAEGVRTAFAVEALATRFDQQMPVCHEVYRVVAGEIPATTAYRGLMKPSHEAEPG
ncbi:MAG: putative glycerol-3-phosphate dehydrogenase [Pseudonocardiales bacterium]|nr:putative glycerol-3-phosphate dehydrogenase [Pseudonocardiales bacterium]